MSATFTLIVILFKGLLNNELHFWRLQLELAVLGSKLSRLQFSWEVSQPVTTDIIKVLKKLQTCFEAH